MCHTWRSVTSEVVQGPILLDTWGGNRRHPCWSNRWCPPQAAANTLEGRAAIQSGLAGTSWNSTQTNAKSCSWGGTSPCTGTGWGPTGWASLLCRKGLGESSLSTSQQHARAAMTTSSTPHRVSRRVARRSREAILPPSLASVRPFLDHYFWLCSPVC